MRSPRASSADVAIGSVTPPNGGGACSRRRGILRENAQRLRGRGTAAAGMSQAWNAIVPQPLREHGATNPSFGRSVIAHSS
jgi:hypothetical protein